MASLALKKNYRCAQSLEQFYSGGPYAVSGDGSFIVCACDDTIKIVDTSNASVKSTIEGDSEPVTALALSPNNNFLFSSSHSRQIRVWDLSSLKCLRSWKVCLRKNAITFCLMGDCDNYCLICYPGLKFGTKQCMRIIIQSPVPLLQTNIN